MECVRQGDSSHVGNIKTTKNGLLVVVEHARDCRIDFRRSSGSKSGKARHEHIIGNCMRRVERQIRGPHGMPYNILHLG